MALKDVLKIAKQHAGLEGLIAQHRKDSTDPTIPDRLYGADAENTSPEERRELWLTPEQRQRDELNERYREAEETLLKAVGENLDEVLAKVPDKKLYDLIFQLEPVNSEDERAQAHAMSKALIDEAEENKADTYMADRKENCKTTYHLYEGAMMRNPGLIVSLARKKGIMLRRAFEASFVDKTGKAIDYKEVRAYLGNLIKSYEGKEDYAGLKNKAGILLARSAKE